MSYPRWLVGRLLRDWFFWGLSLIVLGLAAAMGGCPAPWPQIMWLGGMGAIFVPLVYQAWRHSLAQYHREHGDTTSGQ